MRARQVTTSARCRAALQRALHHHHQVRVHIFATDLAGVAPIALTVWHANRTASEWSTGVRVRRRLCRTRRRGAPRCSNAISSPRMIAHRPRFLDGLRTRTERTAELQSHRDDDDRRDRGVSSKASERRSGDSAPCESLDASSRDTDFVLAVEWIHTSATEVQRVARVHHRYCLGAALACVGAAPPATPRSRCPLVSAPLRSTLVVFQTACGYIRRLQLQWRPCVDV